MSRKAKDLDTLIRLHKWTVDERQRELGVLVGREDQLLAFRRDLDAQFLREQDIAAADPTSAGFLYGPYAARHKLVKENLARMLESLRVEIEQARDRLADAYRQLKVYEEVQKTRATQERVEEARKEQVVLDEIGQTQFRQRQ